MARNSCLSKRLEPEEIIVVSGRNMFTVPGGEMMEGRTVRCYVILDDNDGINAGRGSLQNRFFLVGRFKAGATNRSI